MLIYRRGGEAARRLRRRRRLRRAEDEVVAQTRAGKAGAERQATACARRSAARVDGRPCRGGGREPQDAGLPAGRTAGNGARQGRRLQRYKDGGLSDATTFDAGRRSELEGPGRPHPDRDATCPNGSARAPLPGGWRRAASRATTGLAIRHAASRTRSGQSDARRRRASGLFHVERDTALGRRVRIITGRGSRPGDAAESGPGQQRREDYGPPPARQSCPDADPGPSPNGQVGEPVIGVTGRDRSGSKRSESCHSRRSRCRA